ncbi:hypothetical protein ACTFIR_012099 [Dictyostelium discoideum]
MKVINIILLIILFITNCENVKSIDCTYKPQVMKLNSCDLQARIEVQDQYYSFENVYIEPFLLPINSEHAFYYFLNNGIEYTLNFQNKGCNNNVTEVFKPNGMYYEFITQPKCINTVFDFDLYYYYLNGSSKTFSTKPGTLEYYNYDRTCKTNFLFVPQSTNGVVQNGAVELVNPTCGFNNGSITVDLTKGYSNVRLFRYNDSELNDEVQPGNTAGSFENLPYYSYVLYVESEECGIEIVNIELSDTLPILNIEIKEVPNLFDKSTFSFSFPPGPISNWTDYTASFSAESFEYGYYYNNGFLPGNEKSCETSQYVEGVIPASVLQYTITTITMFCNCIL